MRPAIELQHGYSSHELYRYAFDFTTCSDAKAKLAALKVLLGETVTVETITISGEGNAEGELAWPRNSKVSNIGSKFLTVEMDGEEWKFEPTKAQIQIVFKVY